MKIISSTLHNSKANKITAKKLIQKPYQTIFASGVMYWNQEVTQAHDKSIHNPATQH